MTDVQGDQFHLLLHNFFIHFYAVWKRREEKLLKEEWAWQTQGMVNFTSFPGFDSWWTASQQYFEKDFRDEVDSMVSKRGQPVWYNAETQRFEASVPPRQIPKGGLPDALAAPDAESDSEETQPRQLRPDDDD